MDALMFTTVSAGGAWLSRGQQHRTLVKHIIALLILFIDEILLVVDMSWKATFEWANPRHLSFRVGLRKGP